MNVDYDNLEQNLLSGTFRSDLAEELLVGFRMIRSAGDRLPVATHYASQIAEIIARGAPEPLRATLAYQVYLEILAAVEQASASVLAE
ncbi:MAG TPA: hypothetical protein VF980_16255 [Thermoanaerobaculia bacterium]